MKYAAVALLLATAAAEDTPAACTLTKFEVFKDDKCTKAETELKGDALKTFKEGLTKPADGKCVKDTKTKVVCDGTGITTSIYKADDCKELDEEAMKTAQAIKWDVCSKAGDKYVKATGAKALIASAAVALAFVGSQF